MSVSVIRGDARSLPLPDASVDLIVTSPPYFGLRSYTDGGEHYDGQLGSEASPGEYVAALVGCTAEWMRVLKLSGSLFVNLGDKYSTGNSGDRNNSFNERSGNAPGARVQERSQRRSDPVPGMPPKSLLGLPWRYALAATDQFGLILRAEIIWAKPNGLPESVTDRVRRAHEQVFHFVKRPRYYSAVDEIREPHTGGAHAARKDKGPSPTMTRLAATGDHGMRYSNTDPSMFDPRGKLPGSVWNIPSQPLTVPPALGVDHFAAFPMELPRRIIAGWSPPGVCTACGEGRRPVAQREPIDARHLLSNTRQDSKPRLEVRGVSSSSILRTGLQSGQSPATHITGYACACPQPDAPTRPAIILDPFGGTGTTALLAHALGRHGITIDRSADYCRLAAWRTTDPAELARALEVPKPPPIPEGMDALF